MTILSNSSTYISTFLPDASCVDANPFWSRPSSFKNAILPAFSRHKNFYHVRLAPCVYFVSLIFCLVNTAYLFESINISDFMTGIPALPGDHLPIAVLKKMVTEMKNLQGISRIMYDLTAKPPGTTEWEWEWEQRKAGGVGKNEVIGGGGGGGGGGFRLFG